MHKIIHNMSTQRVNIRCAPSCIAVLRADSQPRDVHSRHHVSITVDLYDTTGLSRESD